MAEDVTPPADEPVDKGLPADVAADRAEVEKAKRDEVEARARRLGWKDKHEFDRPPERWVDAQTYMERGEAALPVLRENFHRVESMLSAEQQQTRTLREDVAGLRTAFDHMAQMAHTSEQRAYERAKRDFQVEKRDLEERIDRSAAAADVQGARTAREALASLREPAPPQAPLQPAAPRPPQPAGPDPSELAAVRNFTARERWFKTPENPNGNDEATEFAGARYSALQRSQPGLTHEERLERVRDAVQTRFAELFGNPAREAPARVASPSLGGAPSPRPGTGTRWEDIPAADRPAAEKMLTDVNRGRKDGKTFTKGEYAELYFKQR